MAALLAIFALACLGGVFGDVNVTDVRLARYSLKEHNTHMFRLHNGFAARRGFPFTLHVTTDQPLEPNSIFRVTDGGKNHVNFTAEILKNHTATEHVIRVNTPIDAATGKYNLTIAIEKDGKTSENSKHVYAPRFYLLFNPYHPKDQTYISHEKAKEYVENEHGMLYPGSVDSYGRLPWYYAQFDEQTLETALWLLQNASAEITKNPIEIARYLVFRVGLHDMFPQGILEGRWEVDFPNGTEPTAWVSSDAIFRRWWKQNHTPVKYGQCWVFAALTTSLLRSIGVPARQVITFGSRSEGRDRNGMLHHVIRSYYDRDGRVVSQNGMVWNFHSWVDMHVAFREEDGLGGWQALDGVSPGLGPASVRAVRELRDGLHYDTSDVISEVRATVQDMIVDCDTKSIRDIYANFTAHCHVNRTVHEERNGVPLIVTKSIGANREEDITLNYVNRSVDAMRPKGVFRRSVHLSSPPTVTVEIRTKRPCVEAGQPIDALITVRAPAMGESRVSLHLIGQLGRYNGVLLDEIHRQATRLVLGPTNHGQVDIAVSIPPEAYLKSDLQHQHVELRVLATTHETDTIVLSKAKVGIVAPDADFTAPEFIRASEFGSNTVHPITVSFTNPLPTTLRNVRVNLYGVGLDFDGEEIVFPVVKSGETINFRKQISAPETPGEYSAVMTIAALGLPPVIKQVTINVI